MSVLKNNRGTSELEFYHTAIKLRKEITQNLLRDFGVKNRDAVRSKNFPDDELRVKIVQEYPKMELFFNKYTRMQEEIRTRDVVSEYPYWLVFRFRDEMMDLLKQLIDNITDANSIYPINLHELEVRRDYQTAAIGACEKMLQELQYIIEVLPADANKLLRYVDMIDKEVALLKGWRKANGKIAKRLDKQQEGNQKQKPSKCKNQPQQAVFEVIFCTWFSYELVVGISERQQHHQLLQCQQQRQCQQQQRIQLVWRSPWIL